MRRYLKVLDESKSVKPLGVTLENGKVAGPDSVVAEDALLGGTEAFEAYLAEKPARVKEVKNNKKGK